MEVVRQEVPLTDQCGSFPALNTCVLPSQALPIPHDQRSSAAPTRTSTSTFNSKQAGKVRRAPSLLPFGTEDTPPLLLSRNVRHRGTLWTGCHGKGEHINGRWHPFLDAHGTCLPRPFRQHLPPLPLYPTSTLALTSPTGIFPNAPSLSLSHPPTILAAAHIYLNRALISPLRTPSRSKSHL